VKFNYVAQAGATCGKYKNCINSIQQQVAMPTAQSFIAEKQCLNFAYFVN
jgi:hypothetical protein